jgi:YidC/Oxa1 family membrane protein insertase
VSEQQRVVLAVVLCAGVFAAWTFFFAPKPPPPADPAAPAPAAAPSAAGEAPAPGPGGAPAAATPSGELVKETRPLETTEIKAAVSNDDAHYTRLELRGFTEHVNGGTQAVSLVATAQDQPYQARVRFTIDNAAGPALLFTDAERGVRLAASTAGGVETSVAIAPGKEPFTFDYKVTARNTGAAPASVESMIELADVHQPAGSFLSGPPQISTAACFVDGSVIRKDFDGLEDGPFSAPAAATWVGFDRQYFVLAVVPQGATPLCRMSRSDTTVFATATFPAESVAAGATLERSFTLFAGPKKDGYLSAVSATLPDLVDYSTLGIPLGFLARPMMFLLGQLHGWTASWGIAILLLTLLVKAITFPITYKSSVSMRRMQLLKPELDKIKDKYPNDRERQQMEQLKLFKEKGVSPLGGCLPMLLQMPIWFALYKALSSSVDLYQQSFLWLPDLTAKEPGFPALAVLIGVVTFLQQQFTPLSPGADNQQAKMMKWVMPPMFAAFMISLPSGLVLYILLNSLLTIGQQAVINRRTVKL